MNTYKANAPVRLVMGVLKLTEKQAARRAHVLREVEDSEGGVYELIGETQFKAGEEFGYDGKVPKSVAALLDGDGEAAEPVKSVQEQEREFLDLIKTAIGELDPDNDDHWTTDEKPQVVAVEAVMDGNISAAQRDQAWAEILEEEEKADKETDDESGD